MKEDGGCLVIPQLYSVFLILAASALPILAAPQQKDIKGCSDHPLFTRMDGYWIQHCAEKQYDEYGFDVGGGKKETIGGRLWTLRYRPQAGQKAYASEIQIHRNQRLTIASTGDAMVRFR
jgi:hypothetical protein